MPLAFLVAGFVGFVMERGIIRFLYGRPLETLLATFGVSLILQQGIRTIFGPTNREVSNPSWMSGSFEIGQMAGDVEPALDHRLRARRLRRAPLRPQPHLGGPEDARRHAEPPHGGRHGHPHADGGRLTFALGSGIAGMAGVALSQVDNVSPDLGQGYIIDSFMVVVFGGVGNLWGTLVGAFSLGIVNKFLEPYAGAVLGKIVVLVLIILFIQKRPRGLFALKGRFVDA